MMTLEQQGEIFDNRKTPTLNRAQRRAKAKLDRAKEKKINKAVKQLREPYRQAVMKRLYEKVKAINEANEGETEENAVEDDANS